jgi:DNA-nicking Smr family endonuclease
MRRKPDPGSGASREEDPDASFAAALDGVVPLSQRDARLPGARAQGSARRPAAEPAHFGRPDPDEPGLGIASGMNTAQLRRLRAGEIRPERAIDLHGMRAEPARRALLAGLRSALLAGERCAIVVHGKGRRSQQAPVLRPALPDWLADPALEGRVLAFAPAAPRDGGSGATYVLLRRARDL